VHLAISEQCGDLQTAAPEAVEAAKHVMNEGYEAHRLRPGDSGYEYDKRVDFGEPEEDNDWDEDDDEDEAAEGVGGGDDDYF
jgi:centrosomal protein CEP19